ncbi:response regulator [Agrobacterium vitis]|uniref:response regulator n=1 Tax=Agrobacterium vitis TaxID=373 RepID=UPI0012E71F71|nr:response regulator [Agrobacterium vitis]MVA12186.1 response regulator [Agrobacterium vitis]
MSDPKLNGLRVLVVEDEALVAMMVEDFLADLGCTVVEVAASVPAALGVANNHGVILDGAVLDVNLGGEKVFPVAEALQTRGIPFVFATGYGAAGIDERFSKAQVLSKPYDVRALQAALVSSGMVRN